MVDTDMRFKLWKTIIALDLAYRTNQSFEIVIIIPSEYRWVWGCVFEKESVYVPWDPVPPQTRPEKLFPILEFGGYENKLLEGGKCQITLSIKPPANMERFPFLVFEALSRIELTEEEFETNID